MPIIRVSDTERARRVEYLLDQIEELEDELEDLNCNEEERKTIECSIESLRLAYKSLYC